MIDLAGKNVGVTGSQGFIGKQVCKVLEGRGAKVFGFEDRSILWNFDELREYLNSNWIKYVIHLAGFNGGIEFNRKYPADVFYINTQLAINIVTACALRKPPTKKLLSVITSCAYPESIGDSDYKEEQLHDGHPNEAVACHGYAKRNLEIASRMYRKQYGLNAVVACPNTVYGPGDRTDSNRTKVMTALIKKFSDAKHDNLNEVMCWGTGSPKREFIYVTDVAELLVRTLEQYEDGNLPLNISSGQEYSIKKLSEIIAEKVGYTGNIKWDTSHPDGAMKKSLDTTKMRKCLGNYDFMPIEQGIKETVKWYTSLASS